jgi:hypothetical protein
MDIREPVVCCGGGRGEGAFGDGDVGGGESVLVMSGAVSWYGAKFCAMFPRIGHSVRPTGYKNVLALERVIISVNS